MSQKLIFLTSRKEVTANSVLQIWSS